MIYYFRQQMMKKTVVPPAKGGDGMVTYSDLFQFGILIVQIVALVIQVNNKKK